jgi:hypothetical protein
MVHLTGYTVEPDMSDEDGEAEQEEIPSDEENKAIMADMRRRMKSGTFDDDDADDSDDSDGSEDDGQVEQVKTHLGDGDEGMDSSEEEQIPAQPQKRKREDTAQQARTEVGKLSPDTPEGQAALAEWHERCFNFCRENPGTKLNMVRCLPSSLCPGVPNVCCRAARAEIEASRER